MEQKNNNLLMTRKRQAIKEHCHSETEEHKDDMEDVIRRSKKEAMKFLHRTKDPKNPHKHRAIVCIICDRCIIGTDFLISSAKIHLQDSTRAISDSGLNVVERFYTLGLVSWRHK